MSDKKRKRSQIIIAYSIGIISGGVLGYIYWRVIGCPTNACPLTSSPYSSTIMGALLGGLISSFILERQKNN